MSARPCASCGMYACDGIECYLEADPEAVERNENLLKLSEQYRDTFEPEIHGDPLMKKRRAA